MPKAVFLGEVTSLSSKIQHLPRPEGELR
jgi:hypothetical protein